VKLEVKCHCGTDDFCKNGENSFGGKFKFIPFSKKTSVKKPCTGTEAICPLLDKTEWYNGMVQGCYPCGECGIECCITKYSFLAIPLKMDCPAAYTPGTHCSGTTPATCRHSHVPCGSCKKDCCYIPSFGDRVDNFGRNVDPGQDEQEGGPNDFETQMFKVCDSDGNTELTWPEVMECEEEYCASLDFECPTENDFNRFDANQDGILTWDEYVAGLA